jgi:hypothetical protein
VQPQAAQDPLSSRGELVAKVFAEHYAPVHIATGAHDRA